MVKLCKNIKTGMDCFIATCFTSLIMIIPAIILSYNYIYIGLIIIVLLIFISISLFVDPIGLLYFVSFDKNGFNIYFCKKKIKTYLWSDVTHVEINNPFRTGKYYELTIKHNTKVLISKTKKIEAEIKKYFTFDIQSKES